MIIVAKIIYSASYFELISFKFNYLYKDKRGNKNSSLVGNYS